MYENSSIEMKKSCENTEIFLYGRTCCCKYVTGKSVNYVCIFFMCIGIAPRVNKSINEEE